MCQYAGISELLVTFTIMTDKKTFAEIQLEIQALQAQAEAIKKEEIPAVIEQLKNQISLYGITAEQLGFVSSKNAASSPSATANRSNKPVAKYRNPETGDEWSGNGRQPQWLKNALEGGFKTKDDFLIED